VDEPKGVGYDSLLDPCVFSFAEHIDEPKDVGYDISLDSCLFRLNMLLNPKMLGLTTC
jgi:hypothetical protein